MSNRKSYWKVCLECGKEFQPWTGTSRSRYCSPRCVGIGTMRRQPRYHGMYLSSEYTAWKHVLQRCLNPKCKQYEAYGGRGITVCPQWRKSFRIFLVDMGPKPNPKLTLERINVNGNYEPGNCKWATMKEQGNNKRSTIRIFVDGYELPLAIAATKIGINPATLYRRLRDGWDDERALTTPVAKQLRSITFKGKTFGLKKWARILGIGFSTLRARLNKNWPLDRALTSTKYTPNGKPISRR